MTLRRLLAGAAALCALAAPMAALAAAPTVDGTATGVFSGGATGSAAITTTQANDVVVVVVGYEGIGGSAGSVSSVTATGLTFTRRAAPMCPPGVGACVEIWWAPAAAVQTAKSITVTLSSSIDDAAIGVFGVQGVNDINSPWDTNGAVPSFTTNGTANAQPAAPAVSTSQANDLIIAGGFTGRSATLDTSSWSGLLAATNGGGTLAAYLTMFRNGVTATQSGVSVPFTAPSGTINVRFVDALTADAGGGGGGGSTPAPNLLLMGVGR